ncbi:hypothetical protein [Cryptosporangium sp. NPDC048952]|uniref:hypothetical protein n=1 Tax=Cryptosporangium sp. NPDC048952 TaxID=3363961 RepID=UPI0037105359
MRRAGLGLLILLLVAACTRPADGRFVQPSSLALPLGDRSSASLSVVSGAQKIGVKVADLGDDLLRVKVRDGQAPVLTHDGDDVSVRFGGGSLEVTLTSRVTWSSVALAGGASGVSVDLRGARLQRLDVTAGLDTAYVWLPAPSGAVTASLSSASRATVYVPPNVATRVSTRSGAGTVDIDGVVTSGVGAGRVWTPSDWAGENDRYDVVVQGGVGELILARARR